MILTYLAWTVIVVLCAVGLFSGLVSLFCDPEEEKESESGPCFVAAGCIFMFSGLAGILF